MFFSCISGTTSNGHGDNAIKPCVSYFIIHDKKFNQEDIFSMFHDEDFHPEIKKIGSDKTARNREDYLKEIAIILKVCLEEF